MNQQPLISIVVPVYNCIQHLPECLKSIRSQTFTDWEAVLVDDGSNDGSGDLCDREAASDPRFRVIRKENGGVSTARNAGIDAARGTYLAFIDSDDLIVPTYLEKLSRAAQRFDADIAICGYDRVFPEWELHFFPLPFSVGLIQGTKDFLMLFTEARTNLFGVSIWAKLYRTEIVRSNNIRFDTSISYEEDCVFNADFAPHIRTGVAVGESMYRYRQQEESLSKGYRKDTFRFLVNGYQRRCALLKQYGLGDYLNNAKGIFFGVVKNTCIKIAMSNLSGTEKLEEYGKLIAFPEVQQAVAYDNKSNSGFSNRICTAIKSKSAKRLNRVMRTWRLMDRAVKAKNNLMKKIRNRGREEEK